MVTAHEEADEALAIVDDPAREILAKLLSIPKIKPASGMEADFYIKLLA